MATGADPLRFVLSSSVRSDLLRAVADGTRTTDELLAAIEASSSAIYSALGRLEDASLVAADGDEWTLTGSGQLVADFIHLRDRLGALLTDAGSYFATHDLRGVPREFRLRMNELAGAEILEASQTEPQRVVRELTERFETAEHADVISPIYAESFGSVMPTSADSRLVLDESVVEAALEAADRDDSIERQLENYADADIRVADVSFALAVTDEALLLSLPGLDGGYDARTEFVAEHERGRNWGSDLFEAVWADAEPLLAHVRRQHL